MNYFLYVDDIRTDDKFYRSLTVQSQYEPHIVRSYAEAIDFFQSHLDSVFILDLDHDLGFDEESGIERNGYDICRYVIENNIHVIAFHIHSMNPVGAANMRQLLTHYGVKEI